VAAKILGVSVDTVQRYSNEGTLEHVRRAGLRPKSPFLFDRNELIEKMAREI
jgi:predicted site-specific integrase-resolvase